MKGILGIEDIKTNIQSYLLCRDVVAQGTVEEYGSIALARYYAKIEKKRAYTDWGVGFWKDVIFELDIMSGDVKLI